MLTKKQENRYLAYDNLYRALIVDPDVYQHDLALRDIVARIGSAVKGIANQRRVVEEPASSDEQPTASASLAQGERPTIGLTKSKAAARDKLVTVIAELAGDLYAYASKTQNAVLQAESQCNKSYLEDISGVRLISFATMIRERLTEYAAPLEAYAVSAARLQEFDAAYASYDQQRNNPRLQIGQNAAVRVRTDGHFRVLAALVKDELMPALRKYERQAPAFFTRVVSAREVIDQPATRRKK